MAPVKTCIFTFSGTFRVFKAERLLQYGDIAVDTIAAPRAITTECGICIRLKKSDESQARRILESAHLEINGVYNE